MKRYLPFLIVSLLAVLVCSCAQWGGDNPLGITGGSKEGYGQNSDLNLPENSGDIDPALVGSWASEENVSTTVFTFYADGTFTMEHYLEDQLDRTLSGLWSVSGNTLTISSGGKSEVYTYLVDGNQLVLSSGNREIVLYRAKRTA
jgi:hypothetical protein